MIDPDRHVAVVDADLRSLNDGVERHSAAAQASIAMINHDVAGKTKSPAA